MLDNFIYSLISWLLTGWGMVISWKQPNDPTIPAKQIWQFLFPGEKWPDDWVVKWTFWIDSANGLCDWHLQTIELCWLKSKNRKRCVQTLVHEFIHMRYGPALKHGFDFNVIEKELLKKLFDEELETVYDRQIQNLMKVAYDI